MRQRDFGPAIRRKSRHSLSWLDGASSFGNDPEKNQFTSCGIQATGRSRSHPRKGYAALFEASSEALKALAADEKFVGAKTLDFFGVARSNEIVDAEIVELELVERMKAAG